MRSVGYKSLTLNINWQVTVTFKHGHFFCSHCRDHVEQLGELLFVENNSARGFCSEDCIEAYYAPIVSFYQNLEQELREKHQALEEESESLAELTQSPEILEHALGHPHEVWTIKNEINEELFFFIYQAPESDASLVVLCTVFDRRPAFVLLVTATGDENLLQEFKVGKRIENPEQHFNFDELRQDLSQELSADLDQMVLDQLEAKKSQILAELLEQRQASDIGFEHFHLYDRFLADTLENPDERYSFKDKAHDELYSFIKVCSFEDLKQKKGAEMAQSFYYIVVAMQIDTGDDEHLDLVPILSFPTTDPALCERFRHADARSYEKHRH